MPHDHIFEKKVLKNGLTVLTVPIDTSASVTMSVFVKVGSRYEPARVNGISHFLEHLFFKGSKKFPNSKRISEVIDSIGGDMNANTGKEHTQYYIRAAAEHLPLVFSVLTDMIQNPLFAEKEIEREKGVIVEEINMYRDNPQVTVDSMFDESMWPNQPLGRDIAGTPEIVRAMTRRDILDYRNRFYQPSNMILALAGRFDEKEVNQLIDKYWSKLPSNYEAKFEPAKNHQRQPNLVVKHKATEQAHMIVGFKGYPYKSDKNNALRVLATTLGGGMSSRLFMSIRERRGLAYYVGASLGQHLDTGNFYVQAGLKISSAPQALGVILSELKKIKLNGITAAELNKAKQYLKGKVALAMEDQHDRLDWYLGQEAFRGKLKTIHQAFEELDAVTLDDVKKVADDVIRQETLNVAVIGPFENKKPFETRLKL